MRGLHSLLSSYGKIQAEPAWHSAAKLSLVLGTTGVWEGWRQHQKYSQHVVTGTMAAQGLDPPSRHPTTSAQHDERYDSFPEKHAYLCLRLIVEP